MSDQLHAAHRWYSKPVITIRKRNLSAISIMTIVLCLVSVSIVSRVAKSGVANADTSCSPYGIVLSGSSWLSGGGVNVCSDGGNYEYDGGNNTVNGVVSGEEWQCVELVNRLYLTKGWTTATWVGNGNTLIDHLPGNISDQMNGSVSYVNPGDAVTMNNVNDPDGHVAVVNTVSGTTINLINQNTESASDVNSSAYIASGSLSGGNATLDMNAWYGYSIQAVAHHPGGSGETRSDQVIETQKADESGGVQQVYSTTSSDVWQSWWDSSSNGIQTDNLINIAQNNIVDSSEVDVPGSSEQELYTATSNSIWETNWGNGSSPQSSEIVSGLSGVEKIIARTEDDSGTTTFQLYVMTTGGTYQYWWNNGSNGIQSTELYSASNPVGISYSVNDGTDQLYTAYPGYVEESWWNPGGSVTNDETIGISQNNITAIDKIIEPDGTNVLAVATSSGEWDAEWGGSVGNMTYYYEVNNFSGALAIARQDDDDGETQLIYLANDGQVQQYEWGATHGGGTAITISQDDIRAIVSDDYDGTDEVYTAAGNSVWETYYVNGSPTTDLIVNIDQQL